MFKCPIKYMKRSANNLERLILQGGSCGEIEVKYWNGVSMCQIVKYHAPFLFI